MEQLDSNQQTVSSSTQIHPSDDQLAMSYRNHYYSGEVRHRLSRLRTPTREDEDKIRLHTKATFHFERDENDYVKAVERGEYDGDTIMDEIIAWEKRENMQVNWGKNEVKEENKIGEADIVDLEGKGTDENLFIID
jgi:hypothetical protein